MARSFTKKKRNKGNRIPKPIILIVAEGQNVTESKYFESFQKQYSNYNIKILRPGYVTDPKKMQEAVEKFWIQKELSEENGDIAFIVLDLDCNSDKAKLIKQLEKKNKSAQFIVSNPCFEVWFLLHFRYSTRSYYDSNEVVNDLQRFIPAYDKTNDVATIIENSLDDALKNANKLKSYYESRNISWPSVDCNPRTDVPVIINCIEEKESSH